MSAIDCIDDVKQLANALHRLKLAGKVERGSDGAWALVGAARAVAPHASDARRAKKAAAPEPDHAAPSEVVLEHMRAAARHSEAALHQYIATLGDPVLDHLIQGARAARDQLAAIQEAARS